jgi:hypothetical protein
MRETGRVAMRVLPWLCVIVDTHLRNPEDRLLYLWILGLLG